MTIKLNGSKRNLDEDTGVFQLVTEVVGDGEPVGVAVALNGTVIGRRDWPETTLSEGDDLEILGATCGG